jgi:hypothetical protein
VHRANVLLPGCPNRCAGIFGLELVQTMIAAKIKSFACLASAQGLFANFYLHAANRIYKTVPEILNFVVQQFVSAPF